MQIERLHKNVRTIVEPIQDHVIPKFPRKVGHYEFSAHGASVEGPNTSSVYTNHRISAWMKTGKSGKLFAASLCNIHGLWQSSKEIEF